MQNLTTLMLVPLLIWFAVWAYLWMLDNKVKRLEQALLRHDAEREEDER